MSLHQYLVPLTLKHPNQASLFFPIEHSATAARPPQLVLSTQTTRTVFHADTRISIATLVGPLPMAPIEPAAQVEDAVRVELKAGDVVNLKANTKAKIRSGRVVSLGRTSRRTRRMGTIQIMRPLVLILWLVMAGLLVRTCHKIKAKVKVKVQMLRRSIRPKGIHIHSSRCGMGLWR